ncbi:MAG: prolyl oligopeptidase family serine peptidase [Bryobacterales bacterium]|nr:prolyl oligopeptidase family serine peptidase [Bryobacteraceae bacterium]MDW8131091.1 prolyl oligopeptidase family serine peptidase [Bryobacterales bacterium]
MLPTLIALLWLQQPPSAPVVEVREVLHGVEIVDPYRWLEESSTSESRAWIEAQDRHARRLLEDLPARAGIERRLADLMRADAMQMPQERAGRYFYLRRRADQEQYVLCMRRGAGAREEVLVDPHPLSPDRTVSIRLMDVAADGGWLAYGVRRGGEDEVEVRFFDVEARRDLPFSLPRARYHSVALLAAREGFYYSRFTPHGPRVYWRALASGSAADREIFGQGYGPETAITARLTGDGRRLLLHVLYGSAGDRTDAFFLDRGSGAVRPIARNIPAAFFVHPAGERFFVLTNWKAPNWRVMAGEWAKPAPDDWREVVPEGPAVIEHMAAAGGRLFISTLENVRSRLRVFDADGRLLRQVRLPSMGAISDINGRWESGEIFYGFASFHIPQVVFRHEVASGAQQIWFRRSVPVASRDFQLRQVWYSSRDGTRVPMFLLHRRGLRRDGQRPVLLTGYGGFNISMTPSFSELAVIWAEQGGVFALPNLRGGSEFGEQWHRAGMLERKQNVFDDFIAAAEWLTRNGYTSPSRLAIYGTSNGGLLVGAAMTQRPELFAAVVCRYPLLDMLRYHRFLVARYWVSEYGSADDPEQFRYLHAYSPYHRVRDGVRYPAVLLVTGEADTRVAPLHARKMAARLQAATASGKPVLLLDEPRAGHSAGLPVSRRARDLALEVAFMLWQTGAAPGPR